ncbi:glycosyltransferase family 1 protein [Paenibacillus sp. PL2-23]|uniref:glycosyltransferase family 1 protein n=1 Tax=Paenibacillus sp. PL2-23 TaxID=2100729 RepID=UPI0030F7AE3D
MNKNGFQFDFLVHRQEEGHYDKEIESLGGRIYRMPNIRPGNYRRYFRMLDRFFEERRDYRVVHSHMNENSGFVLRAAKKAGVPCRIIHSHLSDLKLDYKFPFRIYARLAIKDNPSDYFACSARAGEWLFGRKRENSREVIVLQNAVNTEEFAFNPAVRTEVRAELEAGDRLVVGHIGRFNEQKNHKFLLQVFHSLKQDKEDALLVLAGDGYLRASIEKQADEMGLSDSIRFLGVRADISRLLQGMDLFLFPSLFEGLPVVLIEAQAAGLRCVVSDTITREADITGRVSFVSLQQPPKYWSRAILGVSYEHADTSQLLREHGYDSAAMAEWLGHFYSERIAIATSN